MSRFADPRATRTVPLGPCECPGTPHADGDWCKVRTDLAGTELAILLGLDRMGQDEAIDAILPFIVEWNLLTPEGALAVIDAQSLYDLKGPTGSAIGQAISDIAKENLGLPNSPAAPSPASPRGSGSRTPTKRARPGT